MTIQFYVNSSDEKVVNKNIALAKTVTGVLKDQTSVEEPEIMVTGNLTEYCGYNYAYIPAFGRYYYLAEPSSVRNNLVQIHGHVDVLMSYADNIRKSKALVNRQETEWNLYLDDGTLMVENDRQVQVKKFSSGFGSYNFVLSVAGRQTL